MKNFKPKMNSNHNINNLFRCCCGRAENQHGILTTVQEENEELEVASDAAEDNTDSDDSQPEDELQSETKERVQFINSQGWPMIFSVLQNHDTWDY